MTSRTRPTPDAVPELVLDELDPVEDLDPDADPETDPVPDLGAALDARVAHDYATAALTEDERTTPVTLHVVIAPQVFVRMRAVKGPSGTAWRNRPFLAGEILPADADADHVAHLVRIGHLRAVDVNPRTGKVTTR